MKDKSVDHNTIGTLHYEVDYNKVKAAIGIKAYLLFYYLNPNQIRWRPMVH